MVESTGLENRRAARHRGFESLPLRQPDSLVLQSEVVHEHIADRDRFHPFEDIVPPRRLPACDVGVRCAGGERAAHMDAAMPALPALETVFSHVFHRFNRGMLRVNNQAMNAGIPIPFNLPMQNRCM